MRYISLLIVSLIFNLNSVIGQPVNWNWTTGVGGNLLNDGNVDIGRDAQGNIYMAGDFTGTKVFGLFSLTATSNNQVFVTKISPSGTVLWAISAGAAFSPSYIGGLAVSNGELFVSGTFSNSFTCGSFTQTSSGQSDVFLMKLDPSNGTCIWLQKNGGVYTDVCKEIRAANGGGVVMTGNFCGIANFGSITITNSSNFDKNVFLSRFQSDGSCTFAVRVGGGNISESFDVCQDNSGNLIVTGYYDLTTTFASGPVLVSAGFSDIFISSYNASGNLNWARSAGGKFADSGRGIGADQFGNIYVAGNIFSDTALFGSFNVYDYGNGNLFLTKLSSSGTFLFAKAEGGAQNENINGLSTDQLGGNYLTGSFNGNTVLGGNFLFTGFNDVLIAKYDHTGIFRWAARAGDTGSDYGSSVLADQGGFCNVAGLFYGTVSFGGTVLNTLPGEWSVFLSRIGGGTVGINENEKSFFAVYPNPASHSLYLNLENFNDAIFTMELISVDGKVISSKGITHHENLKNYCLDISNLSAGNYILKIYSSQGEFTKKVVIAE